MLFLPLQSFWAGLAGIFSERRIMKRKTDPINPPHYRAHPSGIEAIQITEALNFCLGNAIKYILRCDEKGDPITDLRKAAWYINREIDRRQRGG